MKELNIAVLASGSGTIIPAIMKKFKIKLVLSNKLNAKVLENAARLGIKSIYAANEDEMLKILQKHDINLILLIGYRKILSNKFVDLWQNKILNVHPSLLPKFAGLMDLKVHAEVLREHETQTGCTVHFVDENLDGGKIIVQKSCEVLPYDTPETLKTRVQKLEEQAMIEAIKIFGENYAS